MMRWRHFPGFLAFLLCSCLFADWYRTIRHVRQTGQIIVQLQQVAASRRAVAIRDRAATEEALRADLFEFASANREIDIKTRWGQDITSAIKRMHNAEDNVRADRSVDEAYRIIDGTGGDPETVADINRIKTASDSLVSCTEAASRDKRLALSAGTMLLGFVLGSLLLRQIRLLRLSMS